MKQIRYNEGVPDLNKDLFEEYDMAVKPHVTKRMRVFLFHDVRKAAQTVITV